jgi:creatinine amidohydrolase/Fe(II)-dependent formamide hydrolase-like protein
MMEKLVVAVAASAMLCFVGGARAEQSVWLEDLTWPEVRDAIAGGATTAIVPTGGTEQNGPHMALGKHNFILEHTAERIAEDLGNTLVAPVMTYVPEGDVDPPSSHMRWAGTLSLPEPVFAAVLEATARSLRAHGFTLICFVGDSGGNRASQATVADTLNEVWRGTGVRVLHVGDYYAAGNVMDWLIAAGETEATIGRHAGILDTSQVLAVRPSGVRPDLLADNTDAPYEETGASGDSKRASAARGERILAAKIDAAVRQIQGVATRLP